MPYVSNHDHYSVLRFVGSGDGRYRHEGRIDLGLLRDTSIYLNIAGDPTASVTLTGYGERRRDVFFKGEFVPDLAYDRRRHFQIVFNKITV